MKVGTPSTLTFSLVAPSGVTYQSPVVTIEENPWPTSSVLTDNGDGTYSITITPNRESKVVIKLKVVQDGKTYYHSLTTTAMDEPNFSLAVEGTTNYTRGGAMTMVFHFQDSAKRTKVCNLKDDQAVIDYSSIKATTDVVGATITGVTLTPGTDPSKATMQGTFSWGSAAEEQGFVTWEFDIYHPVSRIKRRVSYKTDVYKDITQQWLSNGVVYAGVESVEQFVLKFTASGKPVKNVKYRDPHILTGTATIYPETVVIDESKGIYGIRMKPGTTNFNVNPTIVVGNSTTAYNLLNGGFSVSSIATPLVDAMAGVTRQFGILLKDANGPITDAVITGISAGATIDASTGAWGPVDATSGMYMTSLIVSRRNSPGNPFATPTTRDEITVTFTRGGKTFNALMGLTVIWPHVQITHPVVYDNMGQFAATIPGTDGRWEFYPQTLRNLGGVSLGTTANITNNTTYDGKIYFSLRSLLPAQKYVSMLGTANNGFNTSYYVWADYFEVLPSAT